MRNVSGLVFFALLSLSFSSYPMLRSVRSPAGFSDKNVKDIMYSKVRSRALKHEIERLRVKEFEIQSRLARIAMLQKRYDIAYEYVTLEFSLSEELSNRKHIQDLILGKEGDWDGMRKPEFETETLRSYSSSRREPFKLPHVLSVESRRLKEYRAKTEAELFSVRRDVAYGIWRLS